MLEAQPKRISFTESLASLQYRQLPLDDSFAQSIGASESCGEIDTKRVKILRGCLVLYRAYPTTYNGLKKRYLRT
ncbi:MAG: hypothetical protein HC817_06250 [Saprospiraceae bacterium]|nr:hypothetical protein [Saprospiraceae bacterium]